MTKPFNTKANLWDQDCNFLVSTVYMSEWALLYSTQYSIELESSHSTQTSAKAMLFRHSLSDEIKQAEVLSAFRTIVAFFTLTLFNVT